MPTISAFPVSTTDTSSKTAPAPKFSGIRVNATQLTDASKAIVDSLTITPSTTGRLTKLRQALRYNGIDNSCFPKEPPALLPEDELQIFHTSFDREPARTIKDPAIAKFTQWLASTPKAKAADVRARLAELLEQFDLEASCLSEGYGDFTRPKEKWPLYGAS